MDSVKAGILYEKLKGTSIGPWRIDKLKGIGKSAAVFLGSQGTETVAVKIFDDELIEKYGDKAQLARIDRELKLVGKSHPSMVKILDGGFDKTTSSHYIVMEYLDGPNLKECLTEIPSINIGSLIQQLASCAHFFENEGLVHRDIKPENIVILDNYTKLILLDFGVIKPIGQPGFTDDDGIQPFIGTLQYSSPEFLLREEDNSRDGWRALTYYQIGAVLHDLIMRKALFEEYATPFARLVNAIQSTVPIIQSSSVENYLIELARTCLLKQPKARLTLLDWSSFNIPEADSMSVESAKQRVTNRVIVRRAEQVEPDLAPTVSAPQVVNEVIDFLKKAARLLRTDNELFPVIDIVFRPKHCDRMVMRLRASDEHSLLHDLTACIDIEVVEANARAVALYLWGHWGKVVNEEPSSKKSFFKGSVDTSAILMAFESAVYNLVDAGQGVVDPELGQLVA
ncbi:protein kinase [Mesorhizobium sp. LMG17149]|uniref:protein kinase domain-containing protein n=1 Tax=Mesorhizobium sp. LMG17149 TaxID=2968497 RepID=UPI0021178CCD|nr:protein kinase [Mesorhizobium sp. LMG17149]MCQ8873091.1 protein kinase [Mesorhizobium sp. LMG17149]